MEKVKIGNKVFEVAKADNIISRMVGLLGKKSLDSDKALLITPCTSIHTFFMRFPITVIFINETYEITDYAINLKPWDFKFSLFKGSFAVYEIAYKGNEDFSCKKADVVRFLS